MTAETFADVLAELDAALGPRRRADAPGDGDDARAEGGADGGSDEATDVADDERDEMETDAADGGAGAGLNAQQSRLVLVTGRAGAGRTTAINALEDLGFERIDTPPLDFVPAIVKRLTETPRRVAIGVSARTAGFSLENFNRMREALEGASNLEIVTVFLDSADEALRRRYSETRRRHPLAPDGRVEDGLEADRVVMLPLRDRADVVIDTSDLTPADLRQELHRRLADAQTVGPTLSILSFSYRRGLPVDADMVLDCRFLRNPHYDPDLRAEDGRNPAVRAYVAEDPRFQEFVDLIEAQAELLLPAFAAEGKSYVTFAFGCTGGRHRSVTLAEIFGEIATRLGWRPLVRHREIDRDGARSAGAAAPAEKSVDAI